LMAKHSLKLLVVSRYNGTMIIGDTFIVYIENK